MSAASDHLGQLYEIIITGSIDLQFLAVLPETYTFRKSYRKPRFVTAGRGRMQFTQLHRPNSKTATVMASFFTRCTMPPNVFYYCTTNTVKKYLVNLLPEHRACFILLHQIFLHEQKQKHQF